MKKYSCILFDLDHTLWDYEANSEETLKFLFHHYALQQKGITSFNYFFEVFNRVNLHLWDLHDRGLVGQNVIREERFHKVLSEAGLDDFPLSLKFSTDYLAELPKKKKLLPHARESLDYLQPKYPMIIVTNGFDEIQGRKMASSGIHGYFKNIVTSQRAGSRKPSKEIFEFALGEAGHLVDQAVMIGDNLLTDMAGARSAGMDTIYFNPTKKRHEEKVTFEISSLYELRTLL